MAGKVEVCFYCDPNHQGRKDLMIEVGQMKEVPLPSETMKQNSSQMKNMRL